jgi:hypothetical protein
VAPLLCTCITLNDEGTTNTTRVNMMSRIAPPSALNVNLRSNGAQIAVHATQENCGHRIGFTLLANSVTATICQYT